MRPRHLFPLLLNLAAAALGIDVVPPTDWDYPYPWPVQYHNFTSQAQQLSMAYMDVSPNCSCSNGETIILLHGKNFCGATWEGTARELLAAGYRVIIPDQIGFCKSSKPYRYQWSFQQLASNTLGLLEELNIGNLTVMGHSMGGMLSTRFALEYPANTTRLVLVDPLGLEDWKAKGVPWQSIDVSYSGERLQNFTSIKTYEQSTYYAGTWDPAYDRWVSMLASVYNGTDAEVFAWDMASTTDMIYSQPIVYEFPLLKMPTLLMVGDKDNTAIGKAWAPADVKPLLGDYEALGKQVIQLIPNGTLVEFPGLGHAPQIQDPDTFYAALLGWLNNQTET